MINWEITPKTIVFLIDACQFMIADMEDDKEKFNLSEDELSDIGNDIAYYEAILGELGELKGEDEADVDVETV